MADIIHNSKSVPIVIDVVGNIALCTAIDMGGYKSATLDILTGDTVTSVTIYHAATSGGTYYPLYVIKSDQAAAIATLTSVAKLRSYCLPPEVAGCLFLKIVGNAAGTGNVSLKT